MNTTTENSIEPHEPHWLSRSAFQVLALMFFATQGALAWAVSRDNYWLATPLALLASHLMHGLLIGFHEASHGLLRRSRLINEIDGILIGIFSLLPFSLYRAAHQLHHAYLASERDEELWPFVHPHVPRWQRITAAVLELALALVYSPIIFLRIFLRKDSPIRNRKVRRRVWMEIAATVLVWTALLTLIAKFGAWKYWVWLYLIPAALAANMQSLRKYIEHMGLTGTTVNGVTRSIVAGGWTGKLMSFSLLHEPYHGVHHWRSGLPHAELPQHAGLLDPRDPGDREPFHDYRSAILDLFASLADPRIGPQWRGIAKPTRKEFAAQALE